MIPVYYAVASGNTVNTLDDPSVDTDLGSAFTAEIITSHRAVPNYAWLEFRWHNQNVTVQTSATFTFTPVTDGDVSDTDMISTTKSGSAVGEQRIEFPAFKFASRIQSRIRVTAHSGLVEMGDHEFVLIPRRKQRSYAP